MEEHNSECHLVSDESLIPTGPANDPEEPEKVKCSTVSRAVDSENVLFDVLDCVEETSEDSENYFSSDEENSSDTSGSSADSKSNGGSESECEPIFDEYDGNLNEVEECCVVEKPKDLNEKAPLPSGWKEVYHESGTLLYWFPETNVCSLSRPYHLGAGSTKNHDLPETAIPCLNYHNSLKNDMKIDEANETATTTSRDKISKYCKRLFKFKKIKYLKFRSWDVRRSYLRTLRDERNRRSYPFSNNKFVTLPMIKKNEGGNTVLGKKWIINPRGKNYVAVLHEYLQQSLKVKPVYVFSEVDNARTPYAATVMINDDKYGTGLGMSKKEAKLAAAKATLLVLFPKMKNHILIDDEEKTGDSEGECNVASIYNDVDVTDPRVTLLSKYTTEPTPYELLDKCLQKRNESQEIKFDFKMESAECTMSVGHHTVTVQCDNKRDGKQQAAQALLQALHPCIDNWGSLLRLYNNHTTNNYHRPVVEEKMLDTRNRNPSEALLSRLRRRMRQLEESGG